MHAATVFLGAFLLFLVQPIAAKALLPAFGGAPAVWTACMLFFQCGLVAAYVLSDGVIRAGRRIGPAVHGALLLSGAACLPLAIESGGAEAADADPTLRILGRLLAAVGLPYLVLGATAPLLQAWMFQTSGRAPWRLYALSNAGSLLALVAYPAILEPGFDLGAQTRMWSVLFAAFVLGSAWCAARRWRHAGAVPGSPDAAGAGGGAGAAETGLEPTRGIRFLWLGLPATAVVILLGATATMCQDIAVVPLFWILPLGLYLLGMILCFGGPGFYARVRGRWWLLPALGALALGATRGFTLGAWVTIVLLSAGVFAAGVVCHGELYRLRPHPRHLGAFYRRIALGGALGGVFAALVGPRLFPVAFELQIGMGAAVAFVGWAMVPLPAARVPGGVTRRQWIAVSVVAALVLVAALGAEARKAAAGCRTVARNFFGTLRVRDFPADDSSGPLRVLYHGGIRHGQQLLDPPVLREPTAYYGRDSGIGLLLRATEAKEARHVGVVGLGAGTLAAWGRRGDRFRFYEINPLVVEIARTEFSFLRDSEAAIGIVPGDARAAMEREGPQEFDVLAVDAFSGDAVPAHLLSREAFGVYLRHLAPGGVLALHVSNRALDLHAVVAALAADRELPCWIVETASDPDGIQLGSDWVLIPTGPGLPLPAHPRLRPLPATPGVRPWTDGFSALLPLLK